MDLSERQLTRRGWWRTHKPILTFLKHTVAVATFGWDFPLLTELWQAWRKRPRVQARIKRRRAAYRYFGRLIQLSIRLPFRIVIKVLTLGKYPKRSFLWDREFYQANAE